MKTASSLLQITALAALFTIQFGQPEEFRMPGVRRALQTIDVRGGTPVQASGQTVVENCA